MSVAARSSEVLRPNLASSPPALSAHLPAPLLNRRARMPDQRLHSELFGDGDDVTQLLEFFHHHDDLPAQLQAEDGHL